MMKAFAFALLVACSAQPKPAPSGSGGGPPPPPAEGSGGGGGEKEGCICNDLYKPVCGADGKTYSNDCHAKCEKVAIKSEGKCPG